MFQEQNNAVLTRVKKKIKSDYIHATNNSFLFPTKLLTMKGYYKFAAAKIQFASASGEMDS